MSDNIDLIIQVQVTTQTAVPSQAGFGTPLIAAYHTVSGPLVQGFTSVDDAVEAGHDEDGFVVRAMSEMFSQNPRPPIVKVGRRSELDNRTYELKVTSDQAALVYEFTIDGVDLSYTVGSGSGVTETTVAAGIAGVIAGASGLTVTAASSGANVSIIGTALQVIEIANRSRELELRETTTATNVAADLSAISAFDDDWYGLVLDVSTATAIDDAAEWIQARNKYFFAGSCDSKCGDPSSTTDIAYVVKDSGYTQTTVLYHENPGELLAAAAMGRWLPFVPPGSETLAWKTLAGVAGSNVTATEFQALQAKNATTFSDLGGVNVLFEGKSGAGVFCDTIRGIHHQTARIKERFVSILSSARKVPYTDAGVSLFTGAIDSILESGATSDFVARDPAWTVTAPLVANQNPNDRAARRFPGIRYSYNLAGAVHGLSVSGVATP